MVRRLLAALFLTALVCTLTAGADSEAPKTTKDRPSAEIKGDPKILISDASTVQAQLKRAFESLRQKLAVMAGRLENGSDKDKEKAKQLRQALKVASEQGTEAKFDSLIRALTRKDADKSLDVLGQVVRDNAELRKDLQKMIAILSRDDLQSNKEQVEKTSRLLEHLKELIAKQERVRAQTEMGRKNNKELKKDQNKVTKETREAAEGKKSDKNDKGGETKKGEAKPEGKAGAEGKGEAREDVKSKAEGKEGKENKNNEAREGKPGEGKETKPGEGKESNGKESKSGEGKEGKPGDSKSGEGKEGKPGAAKESKPGQSKGKGKAGESKPGAPKPGESKPSTAKPGESKAGASKPAAGKPGESKGKGQGKGESKPGKPSASKPSDSKPGQGKSGASKPGESKPGQAKPPSSKGGESSGEKPPPDENPVKKQIEDANKYQKQAEDELDKNKKDEAADKQTKAIQELEAAKKKLEDLLKQMREEEIERLLADLEKRCRFMLALQIEVRDGTVVIDREIDKSAEKKATVAQSARINKLADQEDEILREASGALKLIQTEGSAVAFAEVFVQVGKDMENIAARLKRTNVDPVTQTIENDVIETLKEMIEALKKAQKEAKTPPKPGKPGQSSGPQDQKLIDQLAELKMIYAMQRRVNARTELYGKQYKGEQAPTPEKAPTEQERKHLELIQGELKDLSNRQEKIGKVTKDIATGKNEAK